MEAQRDRIGEIVGDYRLQRWLGGGTFGTVYLAEHLRDSGLVAVKELGVRLTDSEQFRGFLNEARTIRLRHPHIMPLLDFGLSREDKPFLVMEYAPKGTLRNRHPKRSRVPLSAVLNYATQVASALQYAHEQHLVHRDVKPENMLLRSDDVILLSDFGIATTIHSTGSYDSTPGIGGTVPYMAPEQLRGKPRAASDQYALAVVCYEWLAGAPPFQGEFMEVALQHTTAPPPSLLERVPEIPPQVEEVIFKALAKEPGDRFESVQAFVKSLQEAGANSTWTMPLTGMPDVQPARQFHRTRSVSPSSPPLQSIQKPPSQTAAPPSSMTTRSTELAYTVGKDQTQAPWTGMKRPESTREQRSERQLAHKRGLAKRYAAVLLLLIMVLVGGGGYLFARTSAQGTATPVRRSNTPIVKASASPTVMGQTSSEMAYEDKVAKDGVMGAVDAQRSNNNPYETDLKSETVSRLQSRWAFSTGDIIQAASVVANSTVYVGSFDGKLYALNGATGQQRWAVSISKHNIGSSPAVVNGIVYIGSYDGNFYAFDADSGRQKWMVTIEGNTDKSPAFVNGIIYITSDAGKLYAFDAKSGKQEWVQTLQADGRVVGFSAPAVANGMIYIVSVNGTLSAFDSVDGKQKWSVPTGFTTYEYPVVANGIVYLTLGVDRASLYAFDAMSGKKKWSVPTGYNVLNSPSVANGTVYVATGSQSRLCAFDAVSGEQKWVVAAADSDEVFSFSPTIANGVVYIGGGSGHLYAFDAKSGERKLQISIDSYSAVTVADGFVYVGTSDHKLHAFSLPQGGS